MHPEKILEVQERTIAPRGERSLGDSVRFIVIIAFVFRLLVITAGHTYRITPRRDHFQFGWETGRIARSIAEGHGFSSPTDLDSGPSAWTAPVYPYILAGVFKIFGIYTSASGWAILAFNSLFAALTSWTLYRIADRIFGAWAARATAWTWALFPYLLYWSVRVVWETSLSTFLLTLAVWMAIRLTDPDARRRHWIYFGVLWGLILLTNTALAILLPFLLGWAIARSLDRPRAMVSAGWCVAVAIACVIPWTMRNYEVFGRFIFIRDNLPLELYEANNGHSGGLWTRNEHPGNDPVAMKRMQELGELGFMDEKKRQFESFVREHPGDFARFTLERIWYFWAAPPQETIVAGYDLWVARHTGFFLASAFAFGGLVLSFLHRRTYVWIFAAFLLVYPVPFYIVNPLPRYKHPIEPVMLMLIVYVLSEARAVKVKWPARKRRKLES